MYLGGMGGSGNSAVFNAIIEFFVGRKEEHRFIVVGPTGSTSALLNGSTYHSVFKIQRDRKSKNSNDLNGIPNDATVIAAINERLQGVEYILLDEILMVACEDLQTLASQAAKARNIHDVEFGGLSAIVGGDFAQLPPVSGRALYDGRIALRTTDKMTPQAQSAILDRILWH
jgi:ATP-dependent DNA helicase PIF1